MSNDPYTEGVCYGMYNRAFLHTLMQLERERHIAQLASECYANSEDCKQFIEGVNAGWRNGPNSQGKV